MSARKRGPSDDESFADAVGPLRRMPDRDRVVPPSDSAPPKSGTPSHSPEQTCWIHPDPEVPLLGYASGIDRGTFRRLRSGALRSELEIDLHGLRAEAAREALRAALTRAREGGLRCLRVVHGRGLHSKGAPVLREALPRWLAEPPLGSWVLAFAPAPTERGGAGATVVLLRRDRRE